MPPTTYYVTMTDTFMSGWGLSRGKVNKLVIACATLAEAEIVQANARRRAEMRNVSIRTTRPYYPARRYHVSYHDRSDYPHWFVDQAN